MDRNSVINRKTYEVYKYAEDYADAFICDRLIAPAVALLNKKGYKTYASCQGHYGIEFYEYLNEDISKLDEYKNNKRIIIKEIRESSFGYWLEVDKTLLYILFDDNYTFDDIPNGFDVTINDGLSYKRTCIKSIINFYDENDKHKSIKDVTDEIEYKCDILYNWASKL